MPKANGELHGNSGARNGNSKLTESDIKDIREKMKDAPRGTARGLAGRYGTNINNIYHIAKGLTWRHVK